MLSSFLCQNSLLKCSLLVRSIPRTFASKPLEQSDILSAIRIRKLCQICNNVKFVQRRSNQHFASKVFRKVVESDKTTGTLKSNKPRKEILSWGNAFRLLKMAKEERRTIAG